MMRRDKSRKLCQGFTCLCLWFFVAPCFCFAQQETVGTPVDFAREVLPILSDRCFLCHGPDENARKARLRLDVRQNAIDREAIVAGDSDSSELFERLISEDESMRMPPANSGKPPLHENQIETLRKWIDEGAEYKKHWSFVAPERPEIPTILQEQTDWPKNPIDNFVLAKLTQAGQMPSAVANKNRLARRAALTITGLPPNEQQLQAFLNDNSEDAYEKYVDRLLKTPAYGERMASNWLDVARYSDTDGFQADEPRSNWPWRDWVINAYNDNMPFDQFTIEQFAGDLLDEATEQQILATCFHRNHMTNGEGGRDPDESRVDYVLDRVNTMGTAWLGLTLGCAQCHTHKYDPVTQKEYYQLTAFFNNIDEDGRAGKSAKPYLEFKLPNANERILAPTAAVKLRERELQSTKEKTQQQFDAWVQKEFELQKQRNLIEAPNWKTIDWQQVMSSNESIQLQQEDNSGVWRVIEGNANTLSFTLTGNSPIEKTAAIRIELLPHPSHTGGGLSRSSDGNICLTDVKLVRNSAGKNESDTIKLVDAWADYEQVGFPITQTLDESIDTGWAVLGGDQRQPRVAVFRFAEPIEFTDDDQLQLELTWFSHLQRHFAGRFRVSVCSTPNAWHPSDLTERLTTIESTVTSIDQIDQATRAALQQWQLSHDSLVGQAEANLAIANRELAEAQKKTSVNVMVLREMTERRETFVLQRGVWDQHGDSVRSNTPAVLNSLIKNTENASRLDLAKWLTDRGNPLTARVAVNRYWQMHFGHGLVRTPEDFGLQGEYPTHPKLLDWLAVEFMESGWDVRHIQKLIVTSATFQQSSRLSTQMLETDPTNRLFARGPRFRLPASMIRDQALASSELLTTQIGGPSVRSYQPENVWASSDQGRYPYVLSAGEGLYRRSLYSYWRRNISPPGMFDSAQRRVCQVRVVRTNSPMHALNLLNDTTYVEAARALAERAIKQSGQLTDQVSLMFRYVLCRDATERELELLSRSFAKLKKKYAADPVLANQLLEQGRSTADASIDKSTLAAMTIIASTILNLDETLNLE